MCLSYFHLNHLMRYNDQNCEECLQQSSRAPVDKSPKLAAIIVTSWTHHPVSLYLTDASSFDVIVILISRIYQDNLALHTSCLFVYNIYVIVYSNNARKFDVCWQRQI